MSLVFVRCNWRNNGIIFCSWMLILEPVLRTKSNLALELFKDSFEISNIRVGINTWTTCNELFAYELSIGFSWSSQCLQEQANLLWFEMINFKDYNTHSLLPDYVECNPYAKLTDRIVMICITQWIMLEGSVLLWWMNEHAYLWLWTEVVVLHLCHNWGFIFVMIA